MKKESRKSKKKAVLKVDKESVFEFELLTKIHETLMSNSPIRSIKFNEFELAFIKNFNFLTQKKMIYAANINEEALADYSQNEYVIKIKEFAKSENSEVVVISAKIESELCELEDDEKEMFLEELGVKVSGLDKLIQRSYKLLGLETFFTVGPKEVKAWTFKKGMKAPECAGVIHSDFQRGFIKAETISYEDFIKYNGEQGAKAAGKNRFEGKEYIVKDGDVMHYRFNV